MPHKGTRRRPPKECDVESRGKKPRVRLWASGTSTRAAVQVGVTGGDNGGHKSNLI